MREAGGAWGGPCAIPGRWRGVARASGSGFGLVAALLGVLAFGWWARGQLAERALAWQGRALGVDVSVSSPPEIGLRSITLRGLRVGRTGEGGEAPVRIGSARLVYGLSSLLDGKADALELEDVEIDASFDEEGARLGGLEGLAEGSEEETDAQVPALPLGHVRWASVLVRVQSSEGEARLQTDGELEQVEPGRFRVEGTFRGTHPFGSGTLELSGEGDAQAWTAEGRVRPESVPSELVLSEGAELPFTARGEGDHIELRVAEGAGVAFSVPTAEVAIEGFSLVLEQRGQALLARARATEVADLANPTRFTPLRLEARASGPTDLSKDFDVVASLTSERTGFALNVTGRLDPEAQTGRFAIDAPAVSFEPGVLQPVEVAPDLGSGFEEVRGKVGATGEAQLLASGDLEAGLDLHFDALDFSLPFGRVLGLQAKVHALGPEPLRTAPEQEATIAWVDLGIPLTEGHVRFDAPSTDEVRVQRARFGLAGGEVVARDVTVDLSGKAKAVLEARAIDLTEALALVDLDGLEGEGVLEGSLPVVVEGSQVTVNQAELRAVGPGRIQYRPSAAVDGLARQKEELGMAMQVLEDLRYEDLSIGLDGDTRGVMLVTLKILGHNPNFQDGRSVRFNLNLEAHVADLVRTGEALYRVPDAIEKRLRRSEEP